MLVNWSCQVIGAVWVMLVKGSVEFVWVISVMWFVKSFESCETFDQCYWRDLLIHLSHVSRSSHVSDVICRVVWTEELVWSLESCESHDLSESCEFMWVVRVVWDVHTEDCARRHWLLVYPEGHLWEDHCHDAGNVCLDHEVAHFAF